jgi:ubiquinone biosynthesis monooxygenase Coq7
VTADGGKPRRQPGDPSQQQKVARMVRVDHAGEYGAVRIYEGQLAVLGRSDDAPVLEHMAEQERAHRATFEEMVADRRVRPTALLPLWHVAGFALGAGTALLGREAAMACTVAVEEVIDEHYAGQIEELGNDEPELRRVFEKFREEELEHRDTGLDRGAERAPAYAALTGAVRRATRLAIWLSERI